MRLKPRASILSGKNERRFVVHWMDGWDWAWMSFMMVLWIVLLGAVVYIAVRLGNRPPHGR